jgi:hypothetical protein
MLKVSRFIMFLSKNVIENAPKSRGKGDSRFLREVETVQDLDRFRAARAMA